MVVGNYVREWEIRSARMTMRICPSTTKDLIILRFLGKGAKSFAHLWKSTIDTTRQEEHMGVGRLRGWCCIYSFSLALLRQTSSESLICNDAVKGEVHIRMDWSSRPHMSSSSPAAGEGFGTVEQQEPIAPHLRPAGKGREGKGRACPLRRGTGLAVKRRTAPTESFDRLHSYKGMGVGPSRQWVGSRGRAREERFGRREVSACGWPPMAGGSRRWCVKTNLIRILRW